METIRRQWPLGGAAMFSVGQNRSRIAKLATNTSTPTDIKIILPSIIEMKAE
jgi:hypothetical protein